MGSSSKPKTPDYTKTAIAQGEQDRLTAEAITQANRPNQYSPYGSVTWTSQERYTPDQQAEHARLTQLHDQALASGNKKAASNYAKQANDIIKQDKTKYWDQYTTLSPQEQAIFDADQSNRLLLQQLGGQVGQQARGVLGTAFNPNLTNFGTLGDWKGSQVGLPSADFLSLEGRLPQNTLRALADVAETPGAFQQQGDEVRNALYKQLTRFNEDRFGRAEESERTRLANQGFQVGTTAFDNAMREFNRSRNEAYDQAGLQSVLAGGQEQSRLLNDLLASRASNIGLRQGQFGQDMSLLDAAAGLRGRQFDTDAARYQMGLGERQAEAGYNLSRAQQLAAQRGQEFQEQSYLRNLPINEMGALMSGGQVGMPQMPGFSQASPYAAPDLMGAQNAAYQARLGQSNAQQAGQGQWMSMLGTLGGAYLGGPGGAGVGSYLGSLFG